MKKRLLEQVLREMGWWKDREGGNHEVWTNGDSYESVPRHKEINEWLARKIIKKAKQNSNKESKS